MDFVELNNGVLMPIIGFGTYFPTGEYIEESVCYALQSGYKMLDTAKWYNNEVIVGRAIKKSGIKREDIFITCKIECASYEETIKNVEDSLKKFDTTYFDLILIHWPVSGFTDTYRALEYLYENGVCRAIGLSNFNQELCEYILSVCKIKPQVNQIETNIYFQDEKMNKYLNRVGIVHEGWAPFCEGYSNMLNDSALIEIGQKYNKSPAQITLRYFIQKGIVVIPRSSNFDHIKENSDVFDFNIDDEDMIKISRLDQKRQYSGWPSCMLEETYY